MRDTCTQNKLINTYFMQNIDFHAENFLTYLFILLVFYLYECDQQYVGRKPGNTQWKPSTFRRWLQTFRRWLQTFPINSRREIVPFYRCSYGKLLVKEARLPVLKQPFVSVTLYRIILGLFLPVHVGVLRVNTYNCRRANTGEVSDNGAN